MHLVRFRRKQNLWWTMLTHPLQKSPPGKIQRNNSSHSTNYQSFNFTHSYSMCKVSKFSDCSSVVRLWWSSSVNSCEKKVWNYFKFSDKSCKNVLLRNSGRRKKSVHVHSTTKSNEWKKKKEKCFFGWIYGIHFPLSLSLSLVQCFLRTHESSSRKTQFL